MGVFGALGSIGGCVSGVPCDCGGTCPNTWQICIRDACTEDPLDGATVTVYDSDDVEVDSCVTVYSGGTGSGDEGPNYAASCATSGSPAWTNPTNALLDDGIFATVSVAGLTGTLTWTDFSFAVPTGATIAGIKAEVWVKSTNPAGSADFSAKLVVGGVEVGANKATGTILLSGGSIITYGGATDLWTLTPTVAEINANDFGFAWVGAATASIVSVDYARLTVYWTGAPSGDGCCSFSLPDAGAYYAEVTKTGYLDKTVEIDTICNNTYGSTVDLMPVKDICFHVYVRCENVDVEGATITTSDGGSGTTDADGNWCYNPTAPGTFTYTVFKACCYGETATFDACDETINEIPVIKNLFYSGWDLTLTDSSGSYDWDIGLITYPTSSHASETNEIPFVDCDPACGSGLGVGPGAPADLGTFPVPVSYALTLIDDETCTYSMIAYVPFYGNVWSSLGACCEADSQEGWLYSPAPGDPYYTTPYESNPATLDAGCPIAITFTWPTGIWSGTLADDVRGEPPSLTVTITCT